MTKSELLKKLRCDLLEKEESEVLLSYGAKLLEELRKSEASIDLPYSEMLYCLDKFKGLRTSSILERQIIFAKINRNFIYKAPVLAMLAADSSSVEINRSKFKRIKSLVLFVCICLLQLGATSRDLELITRRVRTLLKPNYNYLWKHLPSFKGAIENISCNLNSEKERLLEEGKDTNAVAIRRLQEIVAPINALINTKEFEEKETPDKKTGSTKSPLKLLLVEQDDVLREEELSYVEVIETIPTTKNIDKQEALGDHINTDKMLIVDAKPPQAIASSRALKSFHTLNRTNAFIKREIALLTDNRRMTTKEVSVFLQTFYQNPNSLISLVLSFGFLFSRSWKQSCAILTRKGGLESGEYLIKRKKFIALSYAPQLPEHPINNDNSRFLSPTESHVLLPIPEKFRLLINECSSLKFADLVKQEDQARELLAKLNRRNNSNINLKKITSFLFFELKHSDIDPTISAYICGLSAQKVPGMYYRTFVAEDICNSYCSTLKNIFDKHSIEYTKHQMPSQNYVIGSNLNVKKEAVAEVFEEIKQQLHSSPTTTVNDMLNFHNLYTAYFYLILSIATGQRPITSPYEDIGQFDLRKKLVWISDKENRSNSASRVLPINETALIQISFFINHLKSLDRICNLEKAQLSKQINNMLLGKEPFLQKFEDNKLVPLRPIHVKEIIGDIWPLKDNWHRHFVPNQLAAKSLPGYLIQSWLGHENFGEESFGKFSGLSCSTLYQISDSMENVFQDLKIEAIKGVKFYE